MRTNIQSVAALGRAKAAKMQGVVLELPEMKLLEEGNHE